MYEDRYKHLGKDQRNASQKGKKKKKGSITHPSTAGLLNIGGLLSNTLLSVVPPAVVPPAVVPPLEVPQLLVVAPLLVPPTAVAASLAAVQATTTGGTNTSKTRQEQYIDQLQEELKDARKKVIKKIN